MVFVPYFCYQDNSLQSHSFMPDSHGHRNAAYRRGNQQDNASGRVGEKKQHAIGPRFVVLVQEVLPNWWRSCLNAAEKGGLHGNTGCMEDLKKKKGERELGENQMLLVQQGSGEVVDWPNSTERHGIVPPPQQVWAKHHSQVAVGHLIHFTVG